VNLLQGSQPCNTFRDGLLLSMSEDKESKRRIALEKAEGVAARRAVRVDKANLEVEIYGTERVAARHAARRAQQQIRRDEGMLAASLGVPASVLADQRRQDALADRDILAGARRDAELVVEHAQIAARDAELQARNAIHVMAMDPQALQTRPEIGEALRAAANATLFAATVARKPNKQRCDGTRRQCFILSTVCLLYQRTIISVHIAMGAKHQDHLCFATGARS
jgi:hypothetical protein